MARKPPGKDLGKDATGNSFLPNPSNRAVDQSHSPPGKRSMEGFQGQPRLEVARQGFEPVESYTSSSAAPSRRGIIYLDADTLRPIKRPVIVARKLERGDFATRWQSEFGQKLSAARAVVCLSQSDLARKSGVRQPHISRLEAGEMEPRLSTIFAIADTLGVLARSLFPTMSWQAGDDITDL